MKYLAPLGVGGISSSNVNMREFAFDRLFLPPSRSICIRSNIAFARIWGLWFGIVCCLLYVHGSQNNSLLFASLIWLLYVANCLTSAWLRWPRR